MQTDRQTDTTKRQMDRQTNDETDKQRDWQTYKPKNTQIDLTQRQTD